MSHILDIGVKDMVNGPGPCNMGLRYLRLFLIVGFTGILIFSVFLPLFSSTAEAISSASLDDESPSFDQNELQGWMADVKEVQTADIWHSEVDPINDADNPGKEPFGTNKTTVYLNLTARGDPKEIIQPFDWVSSMDSSGSMGWNDPNNYRIIGAQHFVDLVEEDVEGSRGATIDFDASAHLVNNRHLTDDYDAIRSDLATIGANGGTNFYDPLEIALDEFRYHGDSSRPWFHLFLTDGQHIYDDINFWPLVDEHADEGIPIYTIGFGNIDQYVLQEMADRTDGQFHYCEDPADLEEVFEDIFEEISSLDETAVEAPPGHDAMIKEVLPPYIEYVEGSIEVLTEPDELHVEVDVKEYDEKTVLELNPERDGEGKMNIDDHISLSYQIKAHEYGHDIPITAYDDHGNPESRVEFYNVSSGETDIKFTPGPSIGVHGPPDPVIGTPRWHGVEAGQPIEFKNRTDEEMSSWPGDCKIETYLWNFGDGGEGQGDTVTHVYNSPGTYDVTLNATTVDNVYNSVTKTITIMSPAPPAPPPPPPPSSPPPPGMGIANPTAQPIQVGVGNPIAQASPVGVGQPTATPQITMQPVATSQPVGMPTTTAIFAGFMPVAAQRNPAEKIKMGVKNLN